jgi:hypothetical protein
VTLITPITRVRSPRASERLPTFQSKAGRMRREL